MKFKKYYCFDFSADAVKVYVKDLQSCCGFFEFHSRWEKDCVAAISSIGIRAYRNTHLVYMVDGSVFPVERTSIENFALTSGLKRIHKNCAIRVPLINRLKFKKDYNKKIESVGLIGHHCLFPVALRRGLLSA